MTLYIAIAVWAVVTGYVLCLMKASAWADRQLERMALDGRITPEDHAGLVNTLEAIRALPESK